MHMLRRVQLRGVKQSKASCALLTAAGGEALPSVGVSNQAEDYRRLSVREGAALPSLRTELCASLLC